MTIQHLAYRLAHDFKGGVVALAALMGRGEKVLQSKINPNIQTHHLSIEELEMLADFADGNLALAEYFAHKINAVVVQLPEMPEGDMALLDAFMEIMRELGALSAEFQRDFSDGVIDVREFERISIAADAVQSKLLAFTSSIRRVVR